LLLFVQPVQNAAMVEHAYEHNRVGGRIPVRRAGMKPGRPVRAPGTLVLIFMRASCLELR
jgi:hypothetical protein